MQTQNGERIMDQTFSLEKNQLRLIMFHLTFNHFFKEPIILLIHTENGQCPYWINFEFKSYLQITLTLFSKKQLERRKMYRFVFSEFNLNVEYWRLNPLFKDDYLKSKEERQYLGVTRLEKCLQIPENVPVFRYEFCNMPYPEGIFIFALDKTILDGTYNYSKNVDGNVFEKHNIKDISIFYDHQPLFVETPHVGQINLTQMEWKIITDWYNSPPFGMKMDRDKITDENVKEGGENSPFPHVFVNLCMDRYKARYIPLHRDGSILKDDRPFELTISFKTGGATPNVVYIVYFYYTDVNLILDTKNTFGPVFRSPYLRMI